MYLFIKSRILIPLPFQRLLKLLIIVFGVFVPLPVARQNDLKIISFIVKIRSLKSLIQLFEALEVFSTEVLAFFGVQFRKYELLALNMQIILIFEIVQIFDHALLTESCPQFLKRLMDFELHLVRRNLPSLLPEVIFGDLFVEDEVDLVVQTARSVDNGFVLCL